MLSICIYRLRIEYSAYHVSSLQISAQYDVFTQLLPLDMIESGNWQGCVGACFTSLWRYNDTPLTEPGWRYSHNHRIDQTSVLGRQ